MNLIDRLVAANNLNGWATAIGVTVVLTLALLLARGILVRRFAAYARSTATPVGNIFADILAATHRLFLLAMALYAGSLFLDLTARVALIVDRGAMVAALVQAALWANAGIVSWLSDCLNEKRKSDAAEVATITVLGFIARLGMWASIALLILDNLGVDVTALVASLGIGGIAVALALQNVLGDVFASMSIALDKPFVIGDFIVVEDVLGTVEYIGLKTTRLRSLSGEQVIFSNADLLKSRIRNYKRMQERRVLFRFGVTYQTSSGNLERIPGIARETVEAQADTRFDRAHFMAYGDSSLDFEIVYYVLDADYNVHMDTQQAILLGLFRRFEAERIEFAYPTRTLLMHSAGPLTTRTQSGATP